MDLLYRRYASPFSFITGYIRAGRLDEFVSSVWKTAQEEKNDADLWDYFLHKVFEGSFDDFKEQLRVDNEHRNMSADTLKATLQHSQDILNNFNPEKGG